MVNCKARGSSQAPSGQGDLGGVSRTLCSLGDLSKQKYRTSNTDVPRCDTITCNCCRSSGLRRPKYSVEFPRMVRTLHICVDAIPNRNLFRRVLKMKKIKISRAIVMMLALGGFTTLAGCDSAPDPPVLVTPSTNGPEDTSGDDDHDHDDGDHDATVAPATDPPATDPPAADPPAADPPAKDAGGSTAIPDVLAPSDG